MSIIRRSSPPVRRPTFPARSYMGFAVALGVLGSTVACVPGVGPNPTTTLTSASSPPIVSASPLAEGPITVVALGDSLTEGTGDESGREGYVGRLRDAIGARPGRSGSTVVNLGRSGWASQDLIDGTGGESGQLDAAVAEIASARTANRPVVATVLVGSNDLWYLYEYGNNSGTTAEEESADRAHYRAALTTIVRGLRGAGAQVVVAVNDDQSRRPVAADAGVRAATFPGISSAEVVQMAGQANAYREVVRSVAAAEGATVADFLDAPLFRNPATLADDGNHPNAAGYDLLADAWLTALTPLAI